MKTEVISHVDYLVAAKIRLIGRFHSFARTSGLWPCITGLCEATFKDLLWLSTAMFWYIPANEGRPVGRKGCHVPS